MSSRCQDELTILQLLHAALSEDGRPYGIVFDNAPVFTAKGYERVLTGLQIEPWGLGHMKRDVFRKKIFDTAKHNHFKALEAWPRTELYSFSRPLLVDSTVKRVLE
jgi:hypothetical protein